MAFSSEKTTQKNRKKKEYVWTCYYEECGKAKQKKTYNTNNIQMST